MNIIGKILVILNLIFALVVGGFLVIDFRTRTDWKNAYEKLKAEMDVTRANSGVSGQTLRDATNQGNRLDAKKKELETQLADQAKVAAAALESQKLQTKDAEDRAKDADLSAQKAIAEKERLKEEVKVLTGTVQNRDKAIQTLLDENKNLRTEAIAKERDAKTTQERNVALLAQITELQRKLALREAGVGDDNRFSKDPNAPNPPSTYVKGRIDRVDAKDRSLVQISLGSDQGLKQNQTLVVYRLSPEPQYLGMIRIVDAREHVSVGRLMPSGTPRILQVGDIVASSTSNQSP